MQQFDLNNSSAYQKWRQQKLLRLKAEDYQQFITIQNPGLLSHEEKAEITHKSALDNFALFRTQTLVVDPENTLKQFGQQLGLSEINKNLCAEDSSLTALTTKETGTKKQYIPYTNRPLSWHTDGYYNPPDQQIHGWLLYCSEDAAEGGENELLDHEIAYIHLRDQNPAFIEALMRDNAMTIPANLGEAAGPRPEVSGPVFSINTSTQKLHMRYSARKRHIVWADDSLTHEAVACLREICANQDKGVVRHRLNPGEGLISNNVLHRREGFVDNEAIGKKRLIYRARYFHRVANS